jgi:hypothetical protein
MGIEPTKRVNTPFLCIFCPFTLSLSQTHTLTNLKPEKLEKKLNTMKFRQREEKERAGRRKRERGSGRKRERGSGRKKERKR